MCRENSKRVKAEYSTSELPVSEQNDSEEEELKPLAAVYVGPEIELNEEQQDPLAVNPLAGCVVWNEKQPWVQSFLPKVKKEEPTETGPEADAGTSSERNELTAAKEIEDASDSGSNRGESPSEERKTSEPESEDIPTDTNKKPFACAHCSETFLFKKSLKKHQQEHREKSQPSTRRRPLTSRKALGDHSRTHLNETVQKKSFPCEICGKEFKQRESMKVHLRVHTGEKPYICDHCGLGFPKGSALNRHRRKHTGELPFTCSTCNKRFALKSALVRHVRCHLNIKPYECKVCEKTFVQSSDFTVHLRVHTGERPYKCHICPKAFAIKGTLNSHMLTHSCERKLVSDCEVCGESFMTKNMNVHMRTHTGEKPFKCRICKTMFARNAHRLKHEETHSDRKGIQCKECGKRLVSKEYLRSHMRCHTGIKPFKCGYCEKAFTHKTTCKNHEVTHTKKYPYNCAECGQGYRDKRKLVAHVESHEKKKPEVKRKRRA